MSLPALSVKRPVFITSLVLLMMFTGAYSLMKLPVSLFPETNVPFLSITTLYPGAGPREVELAVSKHLEDELSTLEGVKKVSANSLDSLSQVWVEFRTGMNMDAVEQRVRDRVALAKARFPNEVEDPIIERFNPSQQPVVVLFVGGESLSGVALGSWVEQELKPALARIPKVGRIDIFGQKRRQIDVVIDPNKVEQYRIPLLQIAQSLKNGGSNIPAGSLTSGKEEIALRAVGQYSTLEDIESKVIAFGNGETSIRVRDMGKAVDTAEKERTQAYYGDKRGVILQVYRQSGANTLEVADRVKKAIDKMNKERQGTTPEIVLVRDGSRMIRDNVYDVWESIAIGVVLTIIIVYFFLGSMRSTLITGFAIPNSLLGAFVLMAVAGFSINILTLLAMSLCVGLLVDDAIVVRENIFKHIEQGMPPREAAVFGANEVAMAVVAVTAAVISMFGPVGFLQGVTGQFFREFGLSVCFAMLISLYDAMAVAPMLSAYWAGGKHGEGGFSPMGWALRGFDAFQSWLEKIYARSLAILTKAPFLSIVGISLLSLVLASRITLLPSGFLPADESPEFNVRIQLPTGSNLEATNQVARYIDRYIADSPFVAYTVLTVGNALQEINKADIYVRLKSPKERQGYMPSEIRDVIRNELASLKDLPPHVEVRVLQNDITGGGFRPFTLVLQTKELKDLELASQKVFAALQKHPSLIAPEFELRPGSRELQVRLKESEAERFGVTPFTVGSEMRARVEGLEVGRLRDKGYEYPISLKSQDTADLWLERKKEILVPNVNMTPVDVRKVASFSETRSPSKIERVNRAYATRIVADLKSGSNIADLMREVDRILEEVRKDVPDLTRLYEGDAESFEEMAESMSLAMLFGIVLLFLVLSSLYESFLLALLNIISLPLAISGAIFALWMFNDGLYIYSVIGVLLLLGVATKNSILLIDTANHKLKNQEFGNLEEVRTAIVDASARRLRPILMTSLALVAGCIPIAIGLNEASAQRTGMGIAIVGGTVSSTFFTLFLIPCLVVLVERWRALLKR